MIQNEVPKKKSKPPPSAEVKPSDGAAAPVELAKKATAKKTNPPMQAIVKQPTTPVIKNTTTIQQTTPSIAKQPATLTNSSIETPKTTNKETPKKASAPPKKPSTSASKKKKEEDRITVPMNISGQMSEIDHLLPHIEAMDVPHEMAVPIVKRMFPNGIPPTAMPAVTAMFNMMNVLGPVPNSINPLFTITMGGYSAADAGAAQHAASLNIIAQLSAATRNRTPHVQNNRITFDSSIADLQSVVERCLCQRGPGAYAEKDAAEAVLRHLEDNIIARTNAYDESRNLGLFCNRVTVPGCDVRLPEFGLKQILDNLIPIAADNSPDECVWGKMCMTLAHGTQLTFRTRNTKHKPLPAWKMPGTTNESGQCILCEVVHTCGMIYAYQRIGRCPPRVLQSFKVICDAETGLPADALLFPDSNFNGLIAPYINADWLFTHLIPPHENAPPDEPYRILRGYFQKR